LKDVTVLREPRLERLVLRRLGGNADAGASQAERSGWVAKRAVRVCSPENNFGNVEIDRRVASAVLGERHAVTAPQDAPAVFVFHLGSGHNDPILFELYKAIKKTRASLIQRASKDREVDKKRLATFEASYFDILRKVHSDTHLLFN
jgi:hypothetical protein